MKKAFHALLIARHFPPEVGGTEISIKMLLDYVDSISVPLKMSAITFDRLRNKPWNDYWKKTKVIRIDIRSAVLKKKLFNFNELIGINFTLVIFLLINAWYLLITGIKYTLKYSKEIDVIHGEGGGVAALAVFLLSKIFNKPATIRLRADFQFTRMRFPSKLLLRFFFKRFSTIFVNSSNIMSDLTSLGVPKNKIVIITNSVDLEKFKRRNKHMCKSKLNLPHDKFVCSFVGALTHDKLTDRVLEAAQLLPRNGKFLFLFIGKGALSDKIKNLEKKFEKIKLIEPVENDTLPYFYNASDILVFGSIDTTYVSRVVMESLACGLPVICSNIPTLALRHGEKVDDNVLPKSIGFLIDPSPKKLAKLLLYLLSNKEVLNKKSEDCRKYAELNFSMNNHEKIIKRLMNCS